MLRSPPPNLAGMSTVLERSDVRTFVEGLSIMPPTRAPSLQSIDFGIDGQLDDLRARSQPEAVDFEFSIAIRGHGKRARLGLHAERRYRVGAATIVQGRTPNGLVELQIGIDPSRPLPYTFHMSTADLAGADPEDAWPVLEFLALSKAPHEFSLGLPGGTPVWNPIPLAEAPIDRSLANLVLQLRTIARRTGAPVHVPASFSAELLHSLDVSVRLLAGAIVSGTWQSAEVVLAHEQAEALTPDDQFRVELHAPLEFEVGPVRVSVDRWARLNRVRFGSPRATAEGVVIRLEPAGDDRVDYRHGPWLTAEEQREMAASIEEGDWVALLGDAVVGSDAQLHVLRAALAASETLPDRIVRAGPSDLPGVM